MATKSAALNSYCESNDVKRKPDTLLVLLAAFGLGIVLTLIMPMTSNDTVAAPASALHAGVIVGD